MSKKNLTDFEIQQILFENDDDDINELVAEEKEELFIIGNDDSASNDDSSEKSDDESASLSMHRHHRRKKTKKRLVNSIDTSLDENNFTKYTCQDDRIKYKAIITKGKKNAPEEFIEWENYNDQNHGRISKENIIQNNNIIRPEIRNKLISISPKNAWDMFITEDIIKYITIETNKKIQVKLDNLSPEIITQKKLYFCTKTDDVEVRAFIGLMYMRGLLQLNHTARKYLFRDDIGAPIFGATMSSKRFMFLCSNITFDDLETRSARWQNDRFAAFRTVFEMFNDRCSSVINPQDYLAIDETLYSCRTKVSFKQYNASKPAKYGLLFKSINSTRTPFTFRAVVYAGKPQGEPGDYYVPGIIPIVKSLVTGLGNKTDLKGRNITMDRLYTSIELFQWLLTQSITGVGTMMLNRKGIPAEIKTMENRSEHSYKVLWETSEKKELTFICCEYKE